MQKSENILKVKIVLFQRLITEKYFYVLFEHLKQTWRKFEEKNWNFFREAQFFFQKSSYSVILLIKFWKVKNSHNFVMGLFSARQNFRATERSKIATWAKNSPVWSHCFLVFLLVFVLTVLTPAQLCRMNWSCKIKAQFINFLLLCQNTNSF